LLKQKFSGRQSTPRMDILLETITLPMTWQNNAQALTYLGYPVYHDQNQLDLFLEVICGKIERHARMFSSRNLSIVGKGLTANTLLLSRLWHILRVVIIPKCWITRCERLLRDYIWPYGYKPSWATIYDPKSKGA
jgi:hypothetical protein